MGLGGCDGAHRGPVRPPGLALERRLQEILVHHQLPDLRVQRPDLLLVRAPPFGRVPSKTPAGPSPALRFHWLAWFGCG